MALANNQRRNNPGAQLLMNITGCEQLGEVITNQANFTN